jgi:RHS repeat-associated protein
MLGSVRTVTDDSGAVTECYDYLPFGWMLTEDENDRDEMGCYPDSPTSYTSEVGEKFTGQIREPVDLDYFIARYYSSGQGRFTSADLPFMDQWEADPGSWNLYAYARNNPFVYIDRTGRDPECVEVTIGSQTTGSCRGGLGDFFLESFLRELPCGLDIVIDGSYSYTTCGDHIPGFVPEEEVESLGLGILDIVFGLPLARISLKLYGLGDDVARVAAREVASFPKNPGQLGHIFRNAPGHLADTPANRQLLTDIASNPANRIGADRFGKSSLQKVCKSHQAAAFAFVTTLRMWRISGTGRSSTTSNTVPRFNRVTTYQSAISAE